MVVFAQLFFGKGDDCPILQKESSHRDSMEEGGGGGLEQ